MIGTIKIQEASLVGRIKGSSSLKGCIKRSANLKGKVYMTALPDSYSGSYSVTPNDETQVLNTKDFAMTDNVTINPIPSNYGKVTWDGTKITIS